MYSHVLVAVDPAHDAIGRHLVAVAKHLAAGGRITMVGVLEPVPRYVAHLVPVTAPDRLHAEARETLAALARESGVPAEIVLGEGSAASAILREIERLGCDAVVLGSHQPDTSDYLIGSTADRVVRHARCTVVVERSSS